MNDGLNEYLISYLFVQLIDCLNIWLIDWLASDVSDYPGGFVLVKSEFGRQHLFASEARDEIVRRMQESPDIPADL